MLMNVHSFIAIKPDGVQVCHDIHSLFSHHESIVQYAISINKDAKHDDCEYSADSLGRSSQDSRSEGMRSYVHHHMFQAEKIAQL